MRTQKTEITKARRFGAQLAKDGASAAELQDTAEDAYGYSRTLMMAFWGGAQSAVSTGRNRAMRGGLTRGL